METVSATPRRKAQLAQYAQRHGQDAASALDEVLATYFEWEQQDHLEALAGIREGIDEVEAGRTQSIEDVFEELRVKHGLPG
jgi:predicted transcriptional regulator